MTQTSIVVLTRFLYALGNIVLLTEDTKYDLYREGNQYAAVVNGAWVATAVIQAEKIEYNPSLEAWKNVLDQMFAKVISAVGKAIGISDRGSYILGSDFAGQLVAWGYLQLLASWPPIGNIEGCHIDTSCNGHTNVALMYHGLIATAYYREGSDKTWMYIDLPVAQMVLEKIHSLGRLGEYSLFVTQTVTLGWVTSIGFAKYLVINE